MGELRIDGETKLVGIFGDPVAHTFSPAMHNAAFAELRLNFVYLPFHVRKEDLQAAVAGIRALGLTGVNVTVPHKETVLPYLDGVAEDAGLIGAVNTIVNRGGLLTGYNTDAAGFLRALGEAGFDPRGVKAVVLGAGGAARAVSIALATAGARQITIFNRTFSRAEGLAKQVREATEALAAAVPWEEIQNSGTSVIREASIIVQTTNLGMQPDEAGCPPVPEGAFHKDQLVVDLIYNPQETRFLKTAASGGATVQNGLKMLLHQGAAAFELWTGVPAPVKVMLNALQKAMGSTRKLKSRKHFVGK